jgi:hypothetical protein
VASGAKTDRDGGSHWIVVSDRHSGSLENRKIPFLCNHEKAPCISFHGLMLAEGRRFR